MLPFIHTKKLLLAMARSSWLFYIVPFISPAFLLAQSIDSLAEIRNEMSVTLAESVHYPAAIIVRINATPPSDYLTMNNTSFPDIRFSYGRRYPSPSGRIYSRVITIGLYDYRWDGHRTGYLYERESDLLVYGLIEAHREWIWAKDLTSASLFLGAGLGWGMWDADQILDEQDRRSRYLKEEGWGPIYSAGAQVKLWRILGEIRLYGVPKTDRIMRTAGVGINLKSGKVLIGGGVIFVAIMIASAIVLASALSSAPW